MDRIRRVVGTRGQRAAVAVALVAIGAFAGAIAFAVQPPVSGDVGPGLVSLDPTLRAGNTVVDLPPLGQVRAKSHRGPLGFEARVDRIDLDQAGAVARGANPGTVLRAQVEKDLRPLLWRLVRQSVVVAIAAGALAGLVLPHRRLRYVGATVAGALGFVVVAGAVTVSSFKPERFDQPRFEGALAAAPDILNTVQRHIDDVDVVEGRLEALSDRVVGLYQSVDGSTGESRADTVILHVSDVHSNPVGIQLIQEAADRFEVDAIIDTGDLTSFGASFEEVTVQRIARMTTPYYVVPGNHDSSAIRRSLVDAGVNVLAPGVVEINGIRLLGVADPTFTADNKMSKEEHAARLERAGEETRRLVVQHRPDVVAVHNPVQLRQSYGLFDVGLAGHRHMPSLAYEEGSVVAQSGSSGATGVGALLTDEDLPYQMQLLQFEDDRLVAVDRVDFAGTDGAFRLERVLVDPDKVDGYPDPEEKRSLFEPFTRPEPPP